MKTALMLGVLLLGASVQAQTPEVQVADDLQRVLEVLGSPQGSIEAGSYRLLYFQRGKVELRDDRVTSVELVSAEEAAQRRLLEELSRAEAAKQASVQRAQLLAEGTAVRAAKRADAAFLAAPASERVAYWRGFQKRYPDVPLGPEYTQALQELETQYASERADAEHRREVGDLEARVDAAERRAREAEERNRYSYVYYSPRVIYTPVSIDHSSRYVSRVGLASYPYQQRSGLSITYRSSPGSYRVGFGPSSSWRGSYCP